MSWVLIRTASQDSINEQPQQRFLWKIEINIFLLYQISSNTHLIYSFTFSIVEIGIPAAMDTMIFSLEIFSETSCNTGRTI